MGGNILEQLGLKPEEVKEIAAPLVAEIAGPLIKDALDKALTNVLPQYVEQVVNAQISKLAPALAAEVGKAVKASVPEKGQGGGVDKSQMLLQLLKGEQAPASPMNGLADFSNAIGAVMQQIVSPMMGLYSKGKQDAMSEIATLGRTGFTFPWEEQGGGAAATVRNRRPKRGPSSAAEVAQHIRAGDGH